jgi:hypothetical protein
MHVDAIGAAVDNGGTELEEVDVVLLDARCLDIVLERGDGLVGFGSGLVEIEAWLHGSFPFGFNWIYVR